jgi:hypothetical protein
MPTITKLTNHRLKVEAVVRPTEDGNGMERRWAFAARCNVTGNEVWVEFDEDTKDAMVKDMTGGIVLPDGSRPIEGFEPA